MVAVGGSGAGRMKRVSRKRSCRPGGPQRNATELQLPLPRTTPASLDARYVPGPADAAAADGPQTPAHGGCFVPPARVTDCPPPGEHGSNNRTQNKSWAQRWCDYMEGCWA